MMRSVLMLAACVVAEGCYRSYDIVSGADAGVDTTVDAVVDTAVDDGVVEPAWVDRNVPDRLVEQELLFAALPDIAWNGTMVGLVYNGQPLGSGREQLNFVPLDERGDVIGDEVIVLDGGGLNSAFPRISDARDGRFLFGTVSESGRDHVYVAVLDESGGTLASVQAPPEDNLADLASAPVRVEDKVYAAVASLGSDGNEAILYRFAYPGLELEASARVGMEDLVGEDPAIVEPTDAYDTEVLLFSRGVETQMVGFSQVNEALEAWGGARVLDAFSPVDAYAIVTTEERYWVFESRFEGMGEGISLAVLEDGEMFSSGVVTGKFYGHTMDADASSMPSWGGTFVMIEEDDSASVYATVGAKVGGERITALIDASDPGEGRLTDIPFPAIAWTGGGFLVVWDDWREEATYALFCSYMELIR